MSTMSDLSRWMPGAPSAPRAAPTISRISSEGSITSTSMLAAMNSRSRNASALLASRTELVATARRCRTPYVSRIRR